MRSEETKNVLKHTGVFHELMIVILRRRELFRAFEEKLYKKDTEQKITKNAFVSYYTMDYTRAQLIDLRKFFETDKSSYKVSSLIKSINDPSIKKNTKNYLRNGRKILKIK
jgi:hypothetical protein